VCSRQWIAGSKILKEYVGVYFDADVSEAEQLQPAAACSRQLIASSIIQYK
jgi:hypothetical protein